MRRSPLSTLALLAVPVVAVLVVWLGLSTDGLSVVGDAADGASLVVGEVEDQLDRDLVRRSDIPWAADEVAHLLGWAMVTFIAGIAFRSTRALSDIAVTAFLASLAIEFVQGWWIDGRSAQAHDLSANSLGIMLALVALVVLQRLVPPRPLAVSSKRPEPGHRPATPQRSHPAADQRVPQKVR